MTRFHTAQHLASWAGTTPGNNESAGKVKSRRTRPGNPYLQGALGTAAMSISHTHDTYLAAKYRRIATRRGPLVGGHGKIPIDGQLISPLAVTETPH
jgi:transposase